MGGGKLECLNEVSNDLVSADVVKTVCVPMEKSR
jgi:hypothetical protein